MTDESANLEAVAALTPERRAIGYKEGVDMHTFTITHKRLVPLEINYAELRRNRTLFPVAYQEIAGNVLGTKHQLIDCRVVNVQKGFTAEGETADVVQCLALQHIEE